MPSIPVPGVIPQATRPGDKLLLEHGCSLCSSGVGAAATELLKMVDVLQSRGTPRVNLVSCLLPFPAALSLSIHMHHAHRSVFQHTMSSAVFLLNAFKIVGPA